MRVSFFAPVIGRHGRSQPDRDRLVATHGVIATSPADAEDAERKARNALRALGVQPRRRHIVST